MGGYKNMNNNKIESNGIVFAGPFLGEFGWELTHWVPHIRWLRSQYKGRKLIVASFTGRHPLYYGIADEFWSLPDWFTKEKYDCDCFESLCDSTVYAKLTKHFKDMLESKYDKENVIWTKTPRGFNKTLRQNKYVLFDKLKASEGAIKSKDELLKDCGNKPVVVLFAREVYRKTFLDVVYNQVRYCEDLRMPLPSNNWPRSNWERLFDMLYKQFHDQVTFVIGGTKNGSCLLNMINKYPDIVDLTDINIAQSLDVTIAMLNSALCSISSQSGPTHLSLQCGCPSFIYGHEQQRHSVDDNPLGTDVVFLSTQLGMYNDQPEVLYKDAAIYIKYLLGEKKETTIPMPKIDIKTASGIKKVGIIGVFDVEGSTNIPFGKAFVNAGYQVDVFNYRTVASKIGWEKTNEEIVKFSAAYDLIIFCKANGVTADTIRLCSRNAVTCWYMMDSIDHLKADPEYRKMAGAASFSVVTTKTVYDALANGKYRMQDIYHILQGVDPKEFYPIEKLGYCYDVVFIGQRSEKRDNYIAKIKDAGFSIKAYGQGYNKPVYGKDFNKACSEGRILLAINNSSPDEDSFSDRIMRYMATKGCVLTEYSEGLENYFINCNDLDWFKTEGELINRVRILVENPDIRNNIAEAGYKKVLAKHTWDKVAEQIIKIATRFTHSKSFTDNS